MKKTVFVLFVSACLLTLNLSVSAQTIIKTYAEASMAQPSLMVGLDSTIYLSVNYADKDSCEVFSVSNGIFTSIFKHVGHTSIADFHVFSQDSLYGPVGERLYAIALNGGGYDVLSNHYDQPLLLSGGNLFVSTGEVVGENYLQHLIVRDIKSGSIIDTVYSYFSSGLPITQHIGVVGDRLYFSVARYPEQKSTILGYEISTKSLDTLATQGNVSYGIGFSGKFAYSLLNSDTTKVDVVLVSLDTTMIMTLDRKIYYDFLSFSKGPNGEFIVDSQENLFVWDGVGEVSSWNYVYEPTSTNWKGRHISSSYDEELTKITYSIFVGETQYQLFQLDSLDIQFVVSKDNKLYIRKPVNDWSQTQILMYDLCPEIRTISSVSDQTYFSAKEIRIGGQINCEVPTLFEASKDIKFMPVSGIDSSQGGSYELKIGSGCPTN